MADGTKIEWTDASWNPIRARLLANPAKVGWHCEHKSPGCQNCYSETFNARLGTGLPFKPGHRKDVEIFLDETMLTQPLRWKRSRTIFVCSMTDLFADFVTDEMLDRVFAVMALCPQHTFQVLTKRSARMREYLSRPGVQVRIGLEALGLCCAALAANPRSTLGTGIIMSSSDINPGALVKWPLRNVWLGVSVEDQARADERLSDFEATPGAVKFVSYEPALQPVDWSGWEFVQQIICGGESGRNARHMHPDCPRGALAFCEQHGIAFFFKQWGEYAVDEITSADPRSLQHPPGHVIYRKVGKKASGRKLFGVEHNGMPANG